MSEIMLNAITIHELNSIKSPWFMDIYGYRTQIYNMLTLKHPVKSHYEIPLDPCEIMWNPWNLPGHRQGCSGFEHFLRVHQLPHSLPQGESEANAGKLLGHYYWLYFVLFWMFMTFLIFFQGNSAKLAGRAGNSMGFRSVDLITVGAKDFCYRKAMVFTIWHLGVRPLTSSDLWAPHFFSWPCSPRHWCLHLWHGTPFTQGWETKCPAEAIEVVLRIRPLELQSGSTWSKILNGAPGKLENLWK